MALSFTNLVEFHTTASQASYATSSYSPASNVFTLAAVLNRKSSAPDTPTLHGNGLTWTQIATITLSDTRRLTLFKAQGPASDGALTADFGGATQTHCCIFVDQAPVSGAIVGSPVTGIQTNASSSFLLTLPAFGSSSNAAYGAFGIAANLVLLVGSGFTELGQSTADTTRLLTEWKLDDTTVDASVATLAATWLGIAVEIEEIPPFAPPLIKPRTNYLLRR